MVEQEYRCYHKRGALVAVDKAVVASKAERVSGREVRDIRASLGRQIFRPSKCRLNHREVTYARGAAVLGDLGVVDRQNHVLCHPAPGSLVHFASCFSTSRRWRMTFRARSICRSKSGLYGVSR